MSRRKTQLWAGRGIRAGLTLHNAGTVHSSTLAWPPCKQPQQVGSSAQINSAACCSAPGSIQCQHLYDMMHAVLSLSASSHRTQDVERSTAYKEAGRAALL